MQYLLLVSLGGAFSMQHIRLSSAARAMRRVERVAAEYGLTLQVKEDFEEFRELTAGLKGRAPLTPIFDPRRSAVGAENGFWVHGTDGAGRTAHLQAVRLAELGEQTLAEHFARNRHLYVSLGLGIDPDSSCFDACPHSKLIRGRICYHGEMWLRDGVDGHRGLGLAPHLPRYGMALAEAIWKPDFMIGLTRPEISLRGMTLRIGYQHFHPRGIRWRIPGKASYYDEWLVWLTGSELDEMLEFV